MRQNPLRRSIDFVTTHNRVTLVVMILLTGAVLAGIPQLDTGGQDGGSADQFEDIDRVQKSQYIFENYTNSTERRSNRSVEPVYVWKQDGNALSKDSLLDGLRYQQELTDRESVQAALHPDGTLGIENMVAMRAAGERGLSLDQQVAVLENTSAASVEQIVGTIVSEDPRAERLLPTDHDGGATSADRRLLVTFDTETDEAVRDDADTALYDTANEYETAGFFILNGDANDAYVDHFFGEMVELVLPAALLLILLVLAFTYRDLVDVVVGMTGVVLSVLWMFGLLGWLGVAAGVISIVPVVLITGLSIDFGFHVFNRYREQRGQDDGIRAPMSRGVRLVATALVLVTVTASIGFLANLANPLPVVRDLGISITLGVVSALVIFVTVVPVLKLSIDGLLERLGLDRHKQALGTGTYLGPVLEQTVTLARRGAPVVIVLALVVGTAGGLAWTTLDEESYQQADGDVAEWKQDLPGPLGWETANLPEQSSHAEAVYQPASANDAVQSQILVEGDVTSRSTLADIDAGVAEIDEEGLLVDQQGTQAVRSPVTAMQRVAAQDDSFAQVFSAADTDGDEIPDQNLETVYDAFYEADSQTAARVLERQDGEYESALVTLSLRADYSDAKSVVPELDDGAAVMADGGERTATAAGSLAVNDAILSEIVDGILYTMLIALAAIGVTLTGVFRYMHGSATLGAVVSFPIVLVVGLVVGGMSLLGIPLTLLTALLMSLVIGLGVDYNIHIGDRFADELRAGESPTEALRKAVTGTGGALLGSTLTSAGAFATTLLVPHPQLQSFGGIVVVALVTSFLVSLLVLPSILLLWSQYSGHQMTVESVTTEPAPQD